MSRLSIELFLEKMSISVSVRELELEHPKAQYGLLNNQTLDVSDLRNHTEYQNGGFDQHPVIRMLWQILQDFNSEEKRAFLKFVTSSPKVVYQMEPILLSVT
jgi:HECT-domain (ubiquitin-transferase)